MSWTTTTNVIRVMVAIHDDAPDDVLVPVDAVLQEVTDHLAERLKALNLPDSVQVEVI